MSLKCQLLLDRFRWKLVILALAIGSAALGLLGPLYQRGFIDSLVGNDTSASFHELLLFFGCFAASISLQLYAQYLGQREANIVQQDISHRLYEQMLRLKGDRLKGTQVGEVVSLYATDSVGAASLVELAWTNGAITLFPLVLAPFMLTKLLNVPVGPLLLTMVISLSVLCLLSWRQSRFFYQFKRLAAERTGQVNEWVQNIRALRALGWTEAFEQRIFRKRLEETNNRIAMVSNGQTMASIGSSIGFFLNLAGIYALVRLRPEGSLTAGELTATFWALGVYLAKPLRGIPWILTFTLDSYTSIKRVERFLGLKSEDIHVPKPVKTPSDDYLNIEGLRLEIDGQELLRDVSLRIPGPEFVAIVGPVGSGKSLFLQSLLGEVPAHFRAYEMQGQSASGMSEESLKAHFSVVPQEGFIASTTIRNNVLLEYADSGPNVPLEAREEARRALEEARLSLDSEGFAEREETVLGERGVNLSGGQRQRLGLARALYTERPFLVMDDSLSAIDVNTERALIDTLFRDKLKSKMVLLVTHRHLILPLADRILFFKEGRLQAQGRFEDLLAGNADFAAFMQEAQKEKKGDGHELLA
jgi:ATP-binding cassette subfamily B multidrug efflux pump